MHVYFSSFTGGLFIVAHVSALCHRKHAFDKFRPLCHFDCTVSAARFPTGLNGGALRAVTFSPPEMNGTLRLYSVRIARSFVCSHILPALLLEIIFLMRVIFLIPFQGSWPENVLRRLRRYSGSESILAYAIYTTLTVVKDEK